ncbi:pentatricopeptide repeat-containing protein At5g08305 [Humulus lupulus]|uniref:pentatricopeptide repeat-containing protein At5g08305 n=1 Tax=Humulus lupulus TaxID=3486 RepID=UPI002B4097F4|nr:pentatricopeptide repeat-containing protein At5g08305 [Humulus lupulus]
MLKPPLPIQNASLSQTLFALLEKCKSMAELKQIHTLLLTYGLHQHDSFASKIISFSALSHMGSADYSFRFLSQLSYPTTFNWNIVIRGYAKSPNPNRSISIFIQMLRNGVKPDQFTYLFLIKASSSLLKREFGEIVHALVAKHGYETDIFIQNTLIHMYASCGYILYARKVFDNLTQRNVVSWTVMMDGYAKCKDMNSARQVFELMPDRDIVSWSSLIDGYVKNGEYLEALTLFKRMQYVGIKANEVTMVSVLCAIAHTGELENGRLMHNYIVENELPLTLVLRTSLVDMYAKCGAIDDALELFRGGSMRKTDVLIWNTMIRGLATHGLVKESLDLFKEMGMIPIVPDEITYLCLLSACGHGGLVKEAWYFFECLNKNGMTPKSEHYACMVDVLTRAGHVAEAFQIVFEMPMKPIAEILGALLSGCINHGRLDLAEIVGRKLIEVEPDHDGRYVGLSNAYAIFQQWDEARRMREAMTRRGVKKSPGRSFV